jgi:hypothetical protein
MGNLIFRFFVRLTLTPSIVLGVGSLFFWLIAGKANPVHCLLFGLCAGLGLGAVLTMIVLPTHFSAVRKAAGRNWKRALIPQQCRNLVGLLSYEDALVAAMATLLTVGNQAEIGFPDADGQLHSRTDATANAYGEEISIKITPMEGGLTRLTLISVPRVKTNLIDYGKGYENIQRMTETLQNIAPKIGEVGLFTAG